MADLTGLRLLLFRVADLVCAAPIEAVREILPPLTPTRLPGAPDSVAGLVNIRGELVTLVHGGRLLQREATAGGFTLLFTLGEQTVAMEVDEVLDLVTLADGDLADRSELPGVDPQLVRAVGRRDGTSFMLLDLDALLGPVLNS